MVATGTLYEDHVKMEKEGGGLALFDKSCFGANLKRTIKLSLYEALYLVDSDKLVVKNGRNQSIPSDQIARKGKRMDREFDTKYVVFSDLRSKGYIVKTALKFGAIFRVYDKGIKPGKDHAKWIVYPVHESQTCRWHEFAAKNRVAHSTRKRLLIAAVDEEQDVTYFEVAWTKP